MTTIRTGLAHLLPLAAVLAADPASGAGALAVEVLDRDGRPVGDVAVYAVLEGTQHAAVAARTASLEQTDNAFVPHLLIVETGTEVTFPNNDTVSHHVYSFSDAKTFELALYKGNVHPPVRFDRPGVVVLGCNIHDGMLGYVLIVDTPHFAQTDSGGAATLANLPAGRYSVRAWTPRARAGNLPDGVTVAVMDGAAASISFRFAGKLMPPHQHGAGALTWDRY